jgi:two-component system, LuxR family, sensor kinase FixL
MKTSAMSGSGAAAFLRSGPPAAIALAAGAAYWTGAVIGLALRLPPATPSVVWLPNAILTAFLLFVPPRRWWAVIVGAAVAHFAVELQVWTMPFVVAIFITNCGEAMIAAGLIRRFNDSPVAFDTLRRISIFVAVGGLFAPFVSSFFDAAVVHVWHAQDYWTVWQLRFRSNALAQLALVPAIAGLLNTPHSLFRVPRRQWLHAAAIAAGFIAVAAALWFDGGRIGLTRSPFALFIAPLLWAAVRFGPAGVGLSVLGTVVLAVESDAFSSGLFPGLGPTARVAVLQICLIAATVPLLCVAALMEERQKAVEALRAEDAQKSSILASIPGLVAIISSSARIVALNENWQRLATERRTGPERIASGARPYWDLLPLTLDRGSITARDATAGIQGVLAGSSAAFVLEYPDERGGAQRWWMLSAVRLKRPDGGAVVTHTDITARKRAELDAQRSRDELARTTRAWVLGELTVTLSHQLNQPLTAISGNAQAGLQFLEAERPNLGEVRAILADIIADVDRAADVTRAVRDLLRKDGCEHRSVDVNELVSATATLLRSEAVARNVALHLALTPSLPLVRAAPAQIRQVLVNLMMNGIEAAAQRSARRRHVVVRTKQRGAAALEVSVRDSGSGLPAGGEERIFEPLFTTRSSGMGLGLPIARGIVEAHGGMLRAGNSLTGGAVFHLVLPLLADEDHGAAAGVSLNGSAGAPR